MTNPITAIADFISGAATKVFNGINIFLLKAQIFGLNIVEIFLFILFIAVVLALIYLPVWVYKYLEQYKSTLNKLKNWFK